MADIPKTRLFHPTPDRLILALLAVEGLLFLADCFRWLPKGWPVLIAIATVGAALVLFLLWFLLSLLFRWQFQFSIRSLLVLTVAVAIPCSWLAWEMKAAREQAATVRAVEDVGGCVAYDYEEDETGSSSFDYPTGTKLAARTARYRFLRRDCRGIRPQPRGNWCTLRNTSRRRQRMLRWSILTDCCNCGGWTSTVLRLPMLG